jgi:hypothetical protein
MKKIILMVLMTLTVISAEAQEAQNIADLDFLYKSIQELPSFKDQLKNDKGYRQTYERLRRELSSSDEFDVYQRLLQLIYPIRDNHLGFWRKPDSSVRFNYIKLPIELKELETKFKTSSKDSIEGFYYSVNGGQKCAIFKQSEGVYYLQNLNSGIVEAILNQSGPGSMDAIQFRSAPVPYVLLRNVRLSNGRLIGLNYQKNSPKSYAGLSTGVIPYEYKKLEENIGYLRLSTFSSSNQSIKVATDFFKKVKPDIRNKSLIVDLRNNGGGGYKTSYQFIVFLKKYEGKIYLLQNGETISNAEQFIIDLKGSRNVITLGETTKGTIAYGSNYGKTLTLPSNRFMFHPTDMNGRARDLAFESIGIKPDVMLDAFSDDWITQTIKYIKANE